MQRLPLKQYAALLCETIGEYDFPTVTYNFAKDNEDPHKDIPHSDGSMLYVEKYIGKLLCSEDLRNVADGLSNVLYWGHAKQGYRDSRVSNFRSWVCNLRETNSDELKGRLDRFVRLARELAGSSIVPSAGGLLKIKELGIPEFGYVSFVSKVLMFLDPARYPVLDREIAKAYAKQPAFPPLQNLTFSRNATSIKITKRNAAVYDTWACWCREIARVVNEVLESPCHVRAVDVERALFILADISDARLLLAGPTG